MNDPRTMTELYKNLSWMYSLLKDGGTDAYYLRVICGSSYMYEVYLRLTEAEVAVFLPAVAAGQPDTLTALAKQVMHYGGAGISGREYLREARPERPQS